MARTGITEIDVYDACESLVKKHGAIIQWRKGIKGKMISTGKVSVML